MKTEMFVESISPYFGSRVYRIARITKCQLITEPLNTTGAVMRFARPACAGLTDGMPLEPFPRRRHNPNCYFLKLKHME